MKSYDAKNAVIQVDGKDHAWTSFAGHGLECPPNGDCSFTIDAHVPAAATRAEVLATEVSGTKDHKTVDDKPLFRKTDVWPNKNATQAKN